MRILNLYSGLGGNRKLWSINHQITAVELDNRIAAVYSRLYPNDRIVIGDAHDFLLNHANEFDFIWSSPPCQTHSKMMKATRHKLNRYVDMSLYQEIIFLNHFYKGPWVVENVIPFYEPLIGGDIFGRHMYWSNYLVDHNPEKTPPNFVNLCNLAGKQKLMNWLNIHYSLFRKYLLWK